MAKDENDKQTTIKRRPFSSNGRVQSSSGGGETSFYDASDFYANYHGNFIQFTSVIDGSSVKFKAFLTAFDDQFSSEWNSEQVYGRNDPIQTFQGTTRKIQIDWDCPAGSIWEAKTNMANAALLVRMLYPGYLRRGGIFAQKFLQHKKKFLPPNSFFRCNQKILGRPIFFCDQQIFWSHRMLRSPMEPYGKQIFGRAEKFWSRRNKNF